MRSLFARPVVHVLVLVLVTAGLVFPDLGGPSLWDVDEGVNAECTREMMEAGTWIVPTFNWELRTAKPILLYWVMRFSYEWFGVTEFAARLPSAVAMFGIVLVTYALARRMFDSGIGFLAGVIAASTLELCKLAHASTTDALLICSTLLYFWGYWRGSRGAAKWWYVPCGIAAGLATLAKGPVVGLVIPGGVVVAHLLLIGEWRQLLTWRMLGGVLAFVLVAGPWYGLVATETRGEWPRAFFLKENIGRASEPMEGHRGIPVLYELMVVCAFFAPWSSFLLASLRVKLPFNRTGEKEPAAEGSLFLLLWVAAYFVACAVASTKLPHYIAPAYPALAILTARVLVRWVRGEIDLPTWAWIGGIAGFMLTGLIVIVGMLVADGTIPVAKLRTFPGLAAWCWIGLLPLTGGGLLWWFGRKNQPLAAVAGLAVSAVLFVGLMAFALPQIVDRRKAVRSLVADSGARRLDVDVRVASFDYWQPSITFYVGRRVERITDPDQAAEFLALALPRYLLIPEPTWDRDVKLRVTAPHRIAARQYDFYRNCDVLVVVKE